MTTSTTRYRTAGPGVISETLEGEAVIINLDTGTYYSLDPIGSAIWDAARAGVAPDRLVAALAARHDAPRSEVEAAVDDVLSDLVREGLLVAVETGGPIPVETAPLPADGGEAPLPFHRPVLNRYTDIQELLLLDPIHEVDEGGWPEPRRASAAEPDLP